MQYQPQIQKYQPFKQNGRLSTNGRYYRPCGQPAECQPLFSECQPLFSEIQPLFSERQPLFSESQPPFSENQLLFSPP